METAGEFQLIFDCTEAKLIEKANLLQRMKNDRPAVVVEFVKSQ
jgi:hypothetical protein